MYHSITKQSRRQRRNRLIIALIIALLLVVGCWFVFDLVSNNLREQAAASVRDSILNSSKQCFAIEGFYPSSITYLEENYGLVINGQDYVINYSLLGDNVMPSVAVFPR